MCNWRVDTAFSLSDQEILSLPVERDPSAKQIPGAKT